MDDTRFSLGNVFQLRNKAFGKIREHTAEIDAIAAATEALDAALTCCIDVRSIDEQQALLTAARLLAAILDGRHA